VTVLEHASQRRRSGNGGRRLGRAALLAVLLAFVFLLGIAFARALDDGNKPGDLTTVVRTLTPLPQHAPTRTVTVTVTAP